MKKMFLVILSIIPLGMFAQEIKYVTVPASQNETLEPVRRIQENGDNWFISLGGGLGRLMNEEYNFLSYGEAAKPTFAVAVGKWVTPVFGLRFSASVARLQGFTTWHEAQYDADGNMIAPAWGWGSWYRGKFNDDPLGRLSTNTYLDAYYGAYPGLYDLSMSGITGSYIEDAYLGKAREITATHHGRDYFLTYAGGSVDMMVNVCNLFSRYRPKRFFNLNVFGGVGIAHTFKETGLGTAWTLDKAWFDQTGEQRLVPGNKVERSKSAVTSIMGKAGLEGTFRLSDRITLNIEPHFLILPEIFSRKVGDDQTQDLVFNALISLTYKFKGSHSQEPLYGSNILYVNPDIINDSRIECCDDLLVRLKRIEEILERQQVSNTSVPYVKNADIERENLQVSIHFMIDKWEVRQSEMYKLDQIAKFMAKHPKIRVSISGYADIQTAHPAYNLKLSERRANEVTRILTARYGIDKSRLKIEHYGDIVQPFSANELNRAVIAFDLAE